MMVTNLETDKSINILVVRFAHLDTCYDYINNKLYMLVLECSLPYLSHVTLAQQTACVVVAAALCR